MRHRLFFTITIIIFLFSFSSGVANAASKDPKGVADYRWGDSSATTIQKMKKNNMTITDYDYQILPEPPECKTITAKGEFLGDNCSLHASFYHDKLFEISVLFGREYAVSADRIYNDFLDTLESKYGSGSLGSKWMGLRWTIGDTRIQLRMDHFDQLGHVASLCYSQHSINEKVTKLRYELLENNVLKRQNELDKNL